MSSCTKGGKKPVHRQKFESHYVNPFAMQN